MRQKKVAEKSSNESYYHSMRFEPFGMRSDKGKTKVKCGEKTTRSEAQF